MATIKRLYVFSTSFLSGIATLFIIISLSTEQWVVSDKIEGSLGFATVKYGLFQGTIRTERPAQRTLVLSSKWKQDI